MPSSSLTHAARHRPPSRLRSAAARARAPRRVSRTSLENSRAMPTNLSAEKRRRRNMPTDRRHMARDRRCTNIATATHRATSTCSTGLGPHRRGCPDFGQICSASAEFETKALAEIGPNCRAPAQIGQLCRSPDKTCRSRPNSPKDQPKPSQTMWRQNTHLCRGDPPPPRPADRAPTTNFHVGASLRKWPFEGRREEPMKARSLTKVHSTGDLRCRRTRWPGHCGPRPM